MNTQVWISRDEIRMSMVAENEEYFSKETKVFKEYTYRINETLKRGQDVFADATHLNRKSRNKLLRSIKPNLATEINVIWIKTPLKECLKRNENRKNTRAYVPKGDVRRMFYQIETPEFEEGIKRIYIIEPNKSIEIKEKI